VRWTGDPRDVLALRKAGFAAWHRTPAQGPWPDHVHAVLIGHPDLAPAAQRQVTAYLNGRDGLADNGLDDGPRLSPIPRFTYPPEDDMPYTDWPDKDRQALAADVAAAIRPELNRLVGDVVRVPGRDEPVMVKTALTMLMRAVGIGSGK
jgi:hypothetical protein